MTHHYPTTIPLFSAGVGTGSYAVRTDRVIGGTVHLMSNGTIVAVWDDGIHKEHWTNAGQPFASCEKEYFDMVARWNE